jgi:hypothetical protein
MCREPLPGWCWTELDSRSLAAGACAWQVTLRLNQFTPSSSHGGMTRCGQGCVWTSCCAELPHSTRESQGYSLGRGTQSGMPCDQGECGQHCRTAGTGLPNRKWCQVALKAESTAGVPRIPTSQRSLWGSARTLLRSQLTDGEAAMRGPQGATQPHPPQACLTATMRYWVAVGELRWVCLR